MDITYGQHALDMIRERDLDRAWVELALERPEATEPDPSDPSRTRAFRAVPERDGRVLRVVYVRSGSTFHVMTAFLDRGRGRKG